MSPQSRKFRQPILKSKMELLLDAFSPAVMNIAVLATVSYAALHAEV